MDVKQNGTPIDDIAQKHSLQSKTEREFQMLYWHNLRFSNCAICQET